MPEYNHFVSREEVKAAITKWLNDPRDRRNVPEVLKAIPATDVAPVVHGRWIPVPSSDMATGPAYKCSNCQKMRYGRFLPPYCQICGAKMDLEENHEH